MTKSGFSHKNIVSIIILAAVIFPLLITLMTSACEEKVLFRSFESDSEGLDTPRLVTIKDLSLRRKTIICQELQCATNLI